MTQVESGNVIVVGVDIANKNHWARIFAPDGLDIVKPFQFKNNREGFQRLVTKIATALRATEISKVIIGMEPTGHY